MIRGGISSTMMRVPLSVNHLLERGKQLFGSREIVSRLPDGSLHRTDFSNLHRRARQLAAALVRSGVRPGEPVATLMWNHAWHLEAYFGIPAAGAVLHTLNLRLSPDDIAYIIRDAGDRILIVDDVLLPLLAEVEQRVELERVIVVSLSGKPVAAPYEPYETFIAGEASDYRSPALDENAACGMCYTSGTTGRPKGVVHSHRSTVLHALSISTPDCLCLSCHDSVLAVTPMFHVNAWGVPFAAAMTGAKLVFPGPRMGAEDVLDLMQSEEVTLALGVPTVWMAIQHALDREPTRWKLRPGTRMMVGGSAAPPSLIAAFEKHGLKIIHGWGMTELCPVGTLSWLKPDHRDLPAQRQYEIRARQGLPIPLMELRVQGESGSQAWDGRSVGELQVRGPIVTGGYHNVPADPEKITADGWFRTGDVATMDAEGRVTLVGRAKDLIITGGFNVYSAEVEQALMQHPAVRDCAVVGLPDDKWGERVTAVIESSAEVDADELVAFVKARIGSVKAPKQVEVWPELPRSRLGKVLKGDVRKRLLA